jgi:hypothetical protein
LTSEPNPVELFLHITGVIGMFVGYGALALGLVALGKAKAVDELKALAGALTYGRRIGFEHVSMIDAIVVTSVIVIGVTGIHMAAYTGDWRLGWTRVAIASFVLLAPIGPLLINPRLQAIARLAANLTGNQELNAIKARLRDPVLNLSMWCSLAILVALVFLMAVKPPVASSILVLVIALLLGGLLAVGGNVQYRSMPTSGR